MITEVGGYGNALGLSTRSNMSAGIGACDLIFNPNTFNAEDPKKRPLGWEELKLKRVYAKEALDRQKGKSEAKIKEAHDEKLTEVRHSILFAYLITDGLNLELLIFLNC